MKMQTKANEIAELICASNAVYVCTLKYNKWEHILKLVVEGQTDFIVLTCRYYRDISSKVEDPGSTPISKEQARVIIRYMIQDFTPGTLLDYAFIRHNHEYLSMLNTSVINGD